MIKMVHKKKYHVTDKYVRERLEHPSKFAKGSFRTIPVKGRRDIKIITACPKGKYARGRCRVGTHAQAILRKR